MQQNFIQTAKVQCLQRILFDRLAYTFFEVMDMTKQKNNRTKERKTNNISIFRKSVAYIFLSLLFFFSLFLFGCEERHHVSALSVLEAMFAVEENCPAGDIYLLAGSESSSLESAAEATYPLFSAGDDLLQAVFGTGNFTNESNDIWQLSPDVIADGALRLSTTASPVEWVVLRCINRSDTDALAELLLLRLDSLRRQYRGTAAQDIADNGAVYVFDHYVILIVAADPAHCAAHAKEIIY